MLDCQMLLNDKTLKHIPSDVQWKPNPLYQRSRPDYVIFQLFEKPETYLPKYVYNLMEAYELWNLENLGIVLNPTGKIKSI